MKVIIVDIRAFNEVLDKYIGMVLSEITQFRILENSIDMLKKARRDCMLLLVLDVFKRLRIVARFDVPTIYINNVHNTIVNHFFYLYSCHLEDLYEREEIVFDIRVESNKMHIILSFYNGTN